MLPVNVFTHYIMISVEGRLPETGPAPRAESSKVVQ